MAFWNWKKKKEETVENEEIVDNVEIAENTENSEAPVPEEMTESVALADSGESYYSSDDLVDNNDSEQSVCEATEGTNNDTDSAATAEEPAVKESFWSRLKNGLSKTRNNIVSQMDSIFSSSDKIDDDFYDELEEIMILGDIGVRTTDNILEKLKDQVKHNHIKTRTDCKSLLIQNIKDEMHSEETEYAFENKQSVIFVIGVNGVGKTTTIGKLASILKDSGRKVMLCAADTFRAAANSQLEEWSHRAGVTMIGGEEGQDPSSVLFDAVNAAKARNVDVLLVDTAGRLHNKKNLMDELGKMNKIIDKSFPDAHRENLIVLDASTGQNALNQAREFGSVANLTGIVLTKMDGSAKGGIAIAIASELKIPVKYIGVGERIDDLQKFDADTFVDALFDVKKDEPEEAEEN